MHSSREKLIAVLVAISMIMILCVACNSGGLVEDDDWDYKTNSPDMFSIPTGNVGIGTDSPTEKLDVSGKVRVRDLPSNDSLTDIVVADASGVLHTRDASTLDGGDGGVGGADNDWFGPGGADPTNTGDIYHLGKVGIGTDSPMNKLDVAGTVHMTGFKMLSGASEGRVLTSDANGVGTWQDAADGSAGGCWQCPGTAVYLAPGMGSVGIGTTTPDANYKLHVQGGNQAIYGIATAGTYESRPFGVVADVNTGAAENTGGGFLTSITTSNTPNIPYVFGGQFWVEDYGNKNARALTLGLADVESDDFGLEILVDRPGYAIYSSGTGTAYFHGDLLVDGNKLFVQAHPTDPTKEIVYACLEGPEAGTYIRGTAELVDGEAVINLPEHFSLVTSDEGLTVQLTPVGEWLQLYVVEKGTQQIVVREANGKDGQFDYLVQGVRMGYEDYQVIRDKE